MTDEEMDKIDADLQFEKALVRYFGTQCNSHMVVLLDKITAVVTAELFAGDLGGNPLCKLNRCFNEVLPILNRK